MVTAKTLVGLACLISKWGGYDPVMTDGQQLSADQVAYATELAQDASVCLPEAFNSHVKNTKKKMASGEISGPIKVAMPCRE